VDNRFRAAAGVAIRQYAAVLALRDGQRGAVVFVRGAASLPAGTNPASFGEETEEGAEFH